MKDKLSTYTFLPWLRQGIANQISGQSGNRATIPISLNITGKKVNGEGEQSLPPITKNIEIYGPGDITGLDAKAIVKVEPRNWITNFEPNYLPYIDFYDEDLPWRYSPDTPTAHNLKPWLALVVLKESEFTEGRNIKNKPLAFIKLSGAAKLQDAKKLYHWAHVHANKDLIDNGLIEGDITKDESNDNSIAKALTNLLDENPDLAHSRIVCPRRLVEKEAYHAFLVPAFESGRLSGLGQEPSGATSPLEPAWDTGRISGGSHEIPYYHRWYFRTGTIGDFEYLARLLEPKPVDIRVGIRDMDVQKPGANLKGIEGDGPLNGILKLGGALRIPRLFYNNEEFIKVQNQEYWAFKDDLTEDEITELSTNKQPIHINELHPFQKNIAAFINLTDSYEEKDAKTVNANSGVIQEIPADNTNTEYDINNNPDPLITAPLYGRWHAMAQRLVKKRDGTSINPNYNWAHEVNLDARWRVSAGFGTKVIQENQEDYMKAAWDQIGDVLEANRKIRQAQLANVVTGVYYNTHLAPIKKKSAGKWLSLAAPMHNRILSQGVTVYHQKMKSKLTLASTSVNVRKHLRPRGKIVKGLPLVKSTAFLSRVIRLFGVELVKPKQVVVDDLLIRINDGEVTAAPPKEKPSKIITTADIVETAKPSTAPSFIIDLLERYPWTKWMPLILALIVVILITFLFMLTTAVITIGLTVTSGLVYLQRLFNKWSEQLRRANAFLDENQTPESVDELPKSSNFRITTPEENFKPDFDDFPDNDEAKRFKKALKDVNGMLQESAKLGKVIDRPKLDLLKVNDTVFKSMNPNLTIPRWVLDGIKLHPSINRQLRTSFVETLAYPQFDLPMYKPLADFSAELFLPNINFVEQNSISILETNQKFIEAYMLGLNHEFARELFWREYPTNQRGSYFRQFWDVNGFLDTNPIERRNILDRFRKILDKRNDVELQEYADRLSDPDEATDENYLIEAHQQILKEELKDIKPLHYWRRSSKLGEHDNREDGEDDKEEVVLVIRGELLKKYPTAVIYAHKAVWQDKNGKAVLNNTRTIDPTKERMLMPFQGNNQENPPKSIIKSPLYEAKVEPDIYFFGFDLGVCEAKGGTGKDEDSAVNKICEAEGVKWDDAGWFFVIKERPGEPRFGLDIGEGGNIEKEIIDGETEESDVIDLWNDLNWGDLIPAVAEGEFIKITDLTPTVKAQKELEDDDDEKVVQQVEDQDIRWHKDMSSAELAYILYQVPVLIGIHAAEMLPDTPTS